MEVFECVSFLLVKNGQMLLEKRSAAKTHDPNIVAIPGGHIELGKTRPMRCFASLMKNWPFPHKNRYTSVLCITRPESYSFCIIT